VILGENRFLIDTIDEDGLNFSRFCSERESPFERDIYLDCLERVIDGGLVLECEHSESVFIILGSFISESEAENCKIIHEVLFVFFQECLASTTTKVHIEDKIEILTEAKVWKIYLVQTSSSLEYEIFVFFSEFNKNKRQEEIFFEFELKKTIPMYTSQHDEKILFLSILILGEKCCYLIDEHIC
jgi:hypothetical protein